MFAVCSICANPLEIDPHTLTPNNPQGLPQAPTRHPRPYLGVIGMSSMGIEPRQLRLGRLRQAFRQREGLRICGVNTLKPSRGLKTAWYMWGSSTQKPKKSMLPKLCGDHQHPSTITRKVDKHESCFLYVTKVDEFLLALSYHVNQPQNDCCVVAVQGAITAISAVHH